jgi:predicted DNA-binding antitoxin AbrB/MazE fold protein
MRSSSLRREFALNLHVGEIVEIRTSEEIFSTLDESGKLDQLPFMPQMLKYCGQRFKVFKRIDKVNDTVEKTGLRRMANAVIFDGVRCDGTSHGGCQALCQIIWKEAWLRRIPDPKSRRLSQSECDSAIIRHPFQKEKPSCTESDLLEATRKSNSSDEKFVCQATEIKKASSYLAWWDIRQDIKDIWSGNVGAVEAIRAFFFWSFTLLLRVGGYRALVALYNRLQNLRGAEPYSYRRGRLKNTPTSKLDLQPGELVQIKSHDRILETLDTNNKNRGLWFDVEMVKYCGGVYKVLRRVDKIIDLKTGRMSNLSSDCIILEGVTTRGDYHRSYPQNEYPFWREIWLNRVGQ